MIMLAKELCGMHLGEPVDFIVGTLPISGRLANVNHNHGWREKTTQVFIRGHTGIVWVGHLDPESCVNVEGNFAPIIEPPQGGSSLSTEGTQ